jgi:hypothetical protein
MVNELLLEKGILKQRYPFKALFVFGPSGSGKTTFAQVQLFNKTGLLYLDQKAEKNSLRGDGFVVINPDNLIEEVFPKFNISMNFDKREEAEIQQKLRHLLQLAENNRRSFVINRAYPIVVDTVGNDFDSLKDEMERLSNIGYDIGIVILYVPKEIAHLGNLNRKGRTIPQKVFHDIFEQYDKNYRNYLTLAKSRKYTLLTEKPFFNIFTHEGNLRNIPNEELSSEFWQNLQEENITFEENQKETQDILQNFKSWINSGVQNPIGQLVLDAMKKLRDTSIHAQSVNPRRASKKEGEEVIYSLGNQIIELAVYESLKPGTKERSGLPQNIPEVTRANQLIMDGYALKLAAARRKHRSEEEEQEEYTKFHPGGREKREKVRELLKNKDNYPLLQETS